MTAHRTLHLSGTGCAGGGWSRGSASTPPGTRREPRREPGRSSCWSAETGQRSSTGSSRVGPAALDLANLVTADSADVARYARTWRQLTGQSLPGDVIELGYRWAALQIPVQYLPRRTEHLSARDVEAAPGRIEHALGRLSA